MIIWLFIFKSIVHVSKILFFLFSRVGSNAFSALSQSMISRYISKYTNIIVNHLSPNYIQFPRTAAAIEDVEQSFRRKYDVPGILSIIAGTHVAVSALSHEIEHAFVNRKGYHSINVQIACNQDMIITNINARYPGSTHDSYIFLGSQLYAFRMSIQSKSEWAQFSNWYILLLHQLSSYFSIKIDTFFKVILAIHSYISHEYCARRKLNASWKKLQ